MSNSAHRRPTGPTGTPQAISVLDALFSLNCCIIYIEIFVYIGVYIYMYYIYYTVHYYTYVYMFVDMDIHIYISDYVFPVQLNTINV